MKRKPYRLSLRHYKFILSKLREGSFVTIFGGEPFLREDILDILKLIEENDKNFVVRVFTNATLTERVVSTLKEIKKPLNVLISVDGPKEIHEKIRGKGTYNKVKETLKRLRKEAPWHKIFLKVTVSKLNINKIEDMLEDLNGLFDGVSFGELHLSGNAKEHKDEVVWEFREWFNIVTKIREKYNVQEVISEDFLNRCGFGKNLVYIREDGYIAGCTEDDYAIYHITDLYAFPEKRLEDFIPIKFPNEACLHCELFWACRGGCRKQAKDLTGSWSGCDLKRREYVIQFLKWLTERI
jgi:radical SAM protein with 4Fe4S-binding SPASM domain